MYKKIDISDIEWEFVNYRYGFDEINEIILKDIFIIKNKEKLRELKINFFDLDYLIDNVNNKFIVNVMFFNKDFKGLVSFYFYVKNDFKIIKDKFIFNLFKFDILLYLKDYYVFEIFIEKNSSKLLELGLDKWDLKWLLENNLFIIKVEESFSRWKGEFSFKVYKKEDIIIYLDKFVFNLFKFDDFSDNVIIKEFLNINKEIVKELNFDESYIKLIIDINDDYKKILEIEYLDYIGLIKIKVYSKRNVNLDLKELINVFELKLDDKFDIDFVYKNFIE